MEHDTTTTPRASAPAQAPAGMGTLKENEAMRRELHAMDWIVSTQSDSIRALATAASKQLGINPSDLEHVRALLGVIASTADDLANTVNCAAEKFGANYVDEADRAWKRDLWRQWHALNGSPVPTIPVGAPA